MTAKVIRRQAWAKVNLTLHVTGRRPNGYHDIESLIVFAGIGDELELAPASDLSLSVSGPFASAIEAVTADNLVLRAARALREHLGSEEGARIRLIKRLPVAAGLGGGSADAAATLIGLSALWAHPADLGLAEVALGLGADVPVCLAGGPSFVTGIGEAVASVAPLPAAWLVLVNPGLALATQAVFADRTGPYTPHRQWDNALADVAALADRLRAFRNDLEPPAIARVPEIGVVLSMLDRTDGCHLARMSGSGATCFGLYSTEKAANRAAKSIAAQFPAWWVAAAPILEPSD